MEIYLFFYNRKYRFVVKLVIKKNILMKYFKFNLRKYIFLIWKVNSDYFVIGFG